MKRGLFFLTWLICGLALPAIAHHPMQHACVAPIRPADDQNDVLWQTFLAEIDEFQACVNAGTQRHQTASREHQDAARATVDLWNRFVKTSLNAPEDFPWPPQEKDE
jgi:hypothetical protein